MSEFEAKKLNVANINSGQKYQNGDGLQAKSFNELVEATLQNSNDIDFIDMILEGSNIYAELELSEAYTSRFTANGANIFDGQLTPVESIRGNTVKNKNLVIVDNQTISTNNTAYSITYPTKTMRFEKGKTYTWSWDYKIVAYTPPNAGVKLGYGFVVKDDEDGGGKSIIYGDPYSNQTVGVVSRQKATFVSPYNGELRYFWFIRTNGNNTTTLEISNVIIEEGATNGEYIPYFTGLKNANINSIVSTGKNLFDKAAAEKVSNWDFSQVYQKFKLFTFKKEKTYTISIEEMNAFRSNHTNISGYDFILTVSSTSGVGSDAQILGGASSATYDGTNKIYRISANDTTDKYLWIYMPNSSFYNDEWLEYVFTNIVKGMMIYEGTQEIPYEPYTTYTYQLPQTVELGEFDTIYPEKGTIERFTKLIDFTNEYTWSVPTEGLIQYNNILYPSPDLSQPLGQGICNLFEHATEPSDKDMTWYFQGGILYFAKKGITNINEWTAYLSTQANNGNPLVLAYKTVETNVVEPCNAPQSYEVYKGGTETIVQGTTDNSEYGAMPTITQTYIGKVGE